MKKGQPEQQSIRAGNLPTCHQIDRIRGEVVMSENRAFGCSRSSGGIDKGGWRIAIVDAVDDLQREGANALLKVLEEPPPRTLLLLISHAPGRELPTIRSRCRRLLLRPLSAENVARAVAADPCDIWNHIIVISKDNARTEIDYAQPCFLTPDIQRGVDLPAGKLMMKAW